MRRHLVELAFEGLVDGFDDLTQWFEQLRAGSFWFVFAGWAQRLCVLGTPGSGR
jgi:hypothetical protein